MADEASKGFKVPSRREARPADPETLFRSLKRAQWVPYLWSHQSDLLRSYCEKHQQTADVALELPTGSGKTLVGLLLAEWRREQYEERVLYLCPTRQLCHQVASQAEAYGIDTRVLVGKQTEYPPDDYGDFATSRAIAITTYSGVFNVNPRLNGHVLVLDDAHAAEGFVSSLWTVSVRRSQSPEIFKELLELIKSGIPRDVYARLAGSQYEPNVISALPYSEVVRLAQSVRDYLNGRSEAGGLPESVYYPWITIRDHLEACQFYYAWGEISVRPVIPPTRTHSVFADARQRIYMSATLGEGGDLERIFGVPNIARLPVPKGWERQGSGRRLILFPDRSLGIPEADRLGVEAIKVHGRALAISPSHAKTEKLAEQLTAQLPGYILLGAEDVEKDLEPFTEEGRAVLLLAGRYDGLDLPDETCRLLIVSGLPAGINLQERFLYERLGAAALLRDRIRTRLTQAMGRCTRNSNDYATVILAGDRLFDFCTKPETRVGLHPELQAEMIFGLDNSEGHESADDFLELIQLFLAQGKDWAEAEKAIIQIREGLEKQKSLSTEVLERTVEAEVNYVLSLWAGDYERALDLGRRVADTLEGPQLTTYRGWWYYLAGVAAWLLSTRTGRGDLQVVARDLWQRARRANPLQTWFREIEAVLPALAVEKGEEVASTSALAIESIASCLLELGLIGSRFERVVQELDQELAQAESTPFELGLQQLGRLLGWKSIRPGGKGTPDGVWLLGDEIGLVFEAKTDETPSGPISKTTALQAAGHLDWARANLPLSERARVGIVVVSRRQHLDRAAVVHSRGLHCVAPSTIQTLGQTVAAALREVRSKSAETELLALHWNIHEVFQKEKLLPEDVLLRLTAQKISDLPLR